MFAGNFPPNGWLFCEGQLLPISENDALFTLIGTTYGGDGQETFGLPDLRGRVPIHQGNASSGTTYQMGQMAGVESVTLTTQQIPIHTHPAIVSGDQGEQVSPQGKMLGSNPTVSLFRPGVPNATLHPNTVGLVGGNQPHENMQPFICINYIISLYGIFPQQT